MFIWLRVVLVWFLGCFVFGSFVGLVWLLAFWFNLIAVVVFDGFVLLDLDWLFVVIGFLWVFLRIYWFLFIVCLITLEFWVCVCGFVVLLFLCL